MIAVFQTYVNQIALAYSNAEQAKRLRQSLQEAQTGITRQIDKHYAEVRLQSLLYFGVALLSSVAGAVAVFYGGWQFFVNGITISDWTAALSAVAGVITEAIGIFVYTQARAAHERMDRYHQELYRLRQFDILLLATEQLHPDAEAEAKQVIIDGASRYWLESHPSDNPAPKA